MKKSALILLAALSVMSFFSCSKPDVETELPDTVPLQDEAQPGLLNGDFYFDYKCFGTGRSGGVRLTRNGKTAYPSSYSFTVINDDCVQIEFGFHDYNGMNNPTPVDIQNEFCRPFTVSSSDFYDNTSMHDSGRGPNDHFITYEIHFGGTTLSLEQFAFQGEYNPATGNTKDYFYQFYEYVLRKQFPQSFSSKMNGTLFNLYKLPVTKGGKSGAFVPFTDWRGIGTTLHRERAEHFVGYRQEAEIAYDSEGFPTSLNYLDGSNWMSFIADSTRMQDLVIPGSHDAMTYSVDAPLSILTCIAVDQWHTVYDQAEFGVRYFDIRTSCGMDKIDMLLAAHGEATSSAFDRTLDMSDMLGGLVRWLQQHPTETIILLISDESHFNLFLHEMEFFMGGAVDRLYYNPGRYFKTFEEGLDFNHSVDVVQWYPDITLGEMRGKICVFYQPSTSAKFNNSVSASITKTQARQDVGEPLFHCGFENFDPSSVGAGTTVNAQTVLAAWEQGYSSRNSDYVCKNFRNGQEEEFKYMAQNIYELSDTRPYTIKEYGADEAFRLNLVRKHEMSCAIWDICRERRDIMPFISCTGYYGTGTDCLEEKLCRETQSGEPEILQESIIDHLKDTPYARGVVTLDFVGDNTVYDTDLEDWGKSKYGPYTVGGLYAVNICWQHNFLGGSTSLYKYEIAKELSPKRVDFR